LLEVGILVTARRWSSDYEWAAHSRIAREAGLQEQIIEAISKREKPESSDPDVGIIYDFATETVWNGCPSDASFDAIVGRYDRSTALDLMALCGYYSLLAFVLNAAQLPLPAGASPLPQLDERGSK
jgi:4-carboxymuconolactone decarboxylase